MDNVRNPIIIDQYYCTSKNCPCVNLTLSDIDLVPSKGEMVVDPFCWNAYGVVDELSVPSISCLKSNPSTLLLGGLLGECGAR